MTNSKILTSFISTCRNIEYTYTMYQTDTEIVLVATNDEVCEKMTWDISFIDDAWLVADHIMNRANNNSNAICEKVA